MYKPLVHLLIIHLLKSSTCFEHYPAHLQEVHVVIVYMQSLVSSLSVCVYLVHRLRKKFFLNRYTRQTPAGGPRRNCIHAVSGIVTLDCLVHRLRKNFFLNRYTRQTSSGGPRRNCIYAVSGIVTLCRCLSCAPVKKEVLS
jgi:hypothetical protein